MSFSSRVKEEIARQQSSARHCCIAEFAAIFHLCGKIRQEAGGILFLEIHTENLTVAEKSYTLLKNTFKVHVDVMVRNHNVRLSSVRYSLLVREKKAVTLILKAIKMLDECGGLWGGFQQVHQRQYARQLQMLSASFGVAGKIVERKKYYVLYMKEGSQIVDFLNIMEAHVALMELENVRILKEVRNSVNRQVNCETANIHKTVTAAARQIEDIRYLQCHLGFSQLADGLREIAQLRMEYPDGSLQELGQMLSPPISKSGVNHRLRKISQIADQMREGRNC